MAVQVSMKRVLVLGHDRGSLLPWVEECGLEVVDDRPDVVITWGGDGLLLGSERDWPGVPKLPLRNSRHGNKCEPHEIREALRHLQSGNLRVTRHTKVRAEVDGQERVGLNDVLIHNSRPTSTVRYNVWIDGVPFGDDEIVGDGVVVATPFGSTAYYRSITRSVFRGGLGLAFNNSTEPIDHLVLPEEARIRVRITRGPALVTADNNPFSLPLEEGDEVLIERHSEEAILLGLGVQEHR